MMLTAQRATWLKRTLRGLAALMLAGAGWGQAGAAPHPAPATPLVGSFIVNSTGDSNAPDAFLTLREALLVARGGTGPAGLNGAASLQERALLSGCTFDGSGNVTGGCGPGISDSIYFSPVLGVNPVITLVAALPAITDTAATYVFGSGNGVLPIIEAGNLGGSTDALLISSNSNTLEGVTLRNAPGDNLTVTGHTNNIGPNVTLYGAGEYGARVTNGDYNGFNALIVGVAAAGSVVCGNGNGAGGILLHSGAISNTISNSTIHCNAGYGVGITGAGTTGNILQASSVREQTGEGVVIDGDAHHNYIGLAGPAFGNVISGNSLNGVKLADSHFNYVYNNVIGLNAAGTIADGNGGQGVDLSAGASNNHVGEAFGIAERNVISGNALNGVLIRDGAINNLVESNYIGLSKAGTVPIGNGGAGVNVYQVNNNTIGSSAAGSAQYIAGNLRGVFIYDGDNNFVGQTNRIGVAGDGVTPMGNVFEGVLIQDGSGNTVLAAVIANNGLASGSAGVGLSGSTAQNNNLAANRVVNNGGLPIDLNVDGHTPNDGADLDGGPNGLLNYPEVTAYSATHVTGTVCANCSVRVYDALGNPAAPGGGGQYLAATTADGAGVWSLALPGGRTRLGLTFMACASPCSFGSATSEFTPRPVLYLPRITK